MARPNKKVENIYKKAKDYGHLVRDFVWQPIYGGRKLKTVQFTCMKCKHQWESTPKYYLSVHGGCPNCKVNDFLDTGEVPRQNEIADPRSNSEW